MDTMRERLLSMLAIFAEGKPADETADAIMSIVAEDREKLVAALKEAKDYMRDIGHADDCDVMTTYGEMGCSCGYRERVFERIDAALASVGK